MRFVAAALGDSYSTLQPGYARISRLPAQPPRSCAGRIADYLHHRITQAQLVDWAETALMDGEFDDKDGATLSAVVARLGVADVRAFGLAWADCEELLGRLGFAARVEIVTN